MKLIPLLLILFSCTTQKSFLETGTLAKPQKFQLTIKRNDVLNISVYSNALDKSADQIYNPVSRYVVNSEGNIKFPRVGEIKAEGLTRKELEDLITSKITDLENPTVSVRITFKISILGDVGRQGTYTIPYGKVNILEALGMAGVTAKDHVKVVRETNGVTEIGIIDLTSKDITQSPYFNLQQNDLVIVGKVKEDNSYKTQRITFALSMITVIAFLTMAF